jgi:ATP-dependent DNA helicase RecQ
MKDDRAAESILRQYWGFDAFRPTQKKIIDSLLSGTDNLVLLPTGGGKSLCYQVPAVIQEGITLVITPLISLMQDQVQNLKKRKIKAETIHAGMHWKEVDRILDNCIYGDIKLLYISPERILQSLAIERIKKMSVSLIAVDEAHCISQWGYDFRPAYLEIFQLRQLHPNAPVVALTATATRKVREDIIDKLQLEMPVISVDSFSRENLSYLVYKQENKLEKLLLVLQKIRGSSIVYVRNRRKTKELAKYLNQCGIKAAAYHAGMSQLERNKIQTDWLNNSVPVIVSTNAFGMGIDKPDVQAVIHYEIPPSPEEYYQEAGRAGRNGQNAFCILLYDNADIKKLKDNFTRSYPAFKDVRQVYQALQHKYKIIPGGGKGESFTFDLLDFSSHFQLDTFKTYHCLKILQQEGWIDLTEAVFLPGRVFFKVEKEQLYEYQVKNPSLDPVIKTILRTYEGVFIEYVRIRESAIASALKVKVAELKFYLERLKKDGILDYIPPSDRPRLTFLAERVERRNFLIDKSLLDSRKRAALDRMKSILGYVETGSCRENFLLNYFAEHKKSLCGHCDHCRKEKTRLNRTDLLERISINGTRLKEIIDSYEESARDNVIKLLKSLEEEEKIHIEDDLVYPTKIKSNL